MNSLRERRFAVARGLSWMLPAVSLALFAACGGADRITGLKPSDSPALSLEGTGLVISQVYGGGGNAGATLKNDFIEIYNPGPAPVTLTGWSVQYGSSGGTTWSTTPLTGTIQPGHYYLVQEAVGAGGTVNLPTPDAVGTIAMSATAGKVALVNSTTALSGACPLGASVVDLIGFGAANCSEGTPTAALSNTTAALRNNDGKTDSNINSSDFTIGAPAPRNSSTEPPVATLIATISPVAPSVQVGATQAFTVAASKGGSPVSVTSAAWSSSNTAAATIDPASGLATAVAPGSTTISVIVTTSEGTASDNTTLTVSPAPVANAVVISQIYGGGGNSGALLKNDFIELYNGGTAPVVLDGWSVQYTSAAATTWAATAKTDLTGTIQPGHYFLVQEAAGSGGTTSLPTPDFTGTIALGATAGKVALVQSTTLLAGGCPLADPSVADFVGYGPTATCAKGSGPTAVLSNTTAALRKDYGRINTNDNAADFEVDDPAPRNSSNTPPVLGPVTTVTIAPTTWSLNLGATKTFIATARDANGNKVSSTFTWATDDATIATVDAAGLVTGKKVGTTKVHAATNGQSGEATVDVVPVAGTIGVQPRANPLPVGFQTQLFLSSGTDSNGNPVGNTDVTWSSASPGIVSVDPNTGVLTANGVGTAVIKATAKSDGISSGTTTITTSDPAVSASARIGHNTELGLPVDADPSDDIIIARRQYTTSYNPARGVTNWVSWNLDATHEGSAVRCNCFTRDTALVRLGFPAFDTNDWINNGLNGQYSRGHMSPSADWQISDGDNAPTFFLTNMLPQNQDMNGGPWGAFENELRVRSAGSVEIYIISGGIFTKNRHGAGSDGFGTISNAGKIAIPDSIWKVAVIVPDGRSAGAITSPSDVEVIAINTPNEKPAAGATWNTYLTTVDKIQRSTGYDLLSGLPEAVQCKIEVRNCAPTAVIAGTGVNGGTEGQTLTFDASGSTDPDAGSTLSYQWNVDGQPAGTGATLNRTFADNGTFSVQLIVTDNLGASTTATTSVTVANVAPAVGSLSNSSGVEGSPFTASGSFTDPGDDNWTATVDYGDGSGVQTLSLTGKSFALQHTYANNGSYSVTVTVKETDAEGASNAVTTSVTVSNVAPIVAAFAGATILKGENYNASGSFSDPGADVWSATVNYGDGAPQSLPLVGMNFQLAHQYLASGVFTVAVQVSDADGGSGNRTASVTVLSPTQAITQLADMVSLLGPSSTSSVTLAAQSSGALTSGEVSSLLSKLNTASAQLARNAPSTAIAALQSFIDQIQGYRQAGRVSDTSAEQIVAYARRIIASIRA